MRQQALAMAADQEAGFEQYRRPTRRNVFLSTMEELVPWSALWAVIEPYNPKPGNGRPPGTGADAADVFRAALVQPDRPRMRGSVDRQSGAALVVGIDMGHKRVLDGAMLLKFRRLLEQCALGAELFAKVGKVLQDRGLKVGTGMIEDAAIIRAPSSTKNADKARDPDMHQTRKGPQLA